MTEYGPISVPGGAMLIGAKTADRFIDELSDIRERGFCSLFDTADAALALEDGLEKESLLIKLAAEALFYSNSLREEREAAAQHARTVTLTPETYGQHTVRFEDGVGAWQCACGTVNQLPAESRCRSCGTTDCESKGTITCTGVGTLTFTGGDQERGS